MTYPLPALCGWSAALLGVVTIAFGDSRGAGVPDYFSGPRTTSVKLSGIRVRLGEPIQVADNFGRAWYPTIARFASGELLLTYSQVSDTHQNSVLVSSFQISSDQGRTWGHRYDVIPEHQPMIFLPTRDGSLLGLPAQLYPLDRDGSKSFHGAATRFEGGGKRVVFEPRGVVVKDWPWPIEVVPLKSPSSNRYIRAAFDGSAIQVGNRWLATGYARNGTNPLQCNLVFASEDEGRTWRYWSTISEPREDLLAALEMQFPVHSEPKGYGGPSETALIQLEDGDLMAVFRVGSGLHWKLGRAYSKDGGRSWSKTDFIPAYSVEPSMVRTRNGVIALSTGRPGVHLWISADGRGQKWQDVDILKHHNLWAPSATHRMEPNQTTAYTEIVEVAPNILLLVYDRVPFGWEAVPFESEERARIFAVPVEIRRE